MTCESCRDLLPLHVYGDLTPTETAAVEVHLTACTACRAEFAALADVQRALAATPVPEVAVDAGRLLAEAATRQARRWRRLALAGAAIAAGLLAFVATRLEVRAGPVPADPYGRRCTRGGRRERSASSRAGCGSRPGLPRGRDVTCKYVTPTS